MRSDAMRARPDFFELHARGRQARSEALFTLIARLRGALRARAQRRKTLGLLRELDDAILRDIGLTRADLGPYPSAYLERRCKEAGPNDPI